MSDPIAPVTTPLVLASASSRRREIIDALDVVVELAAATGPESPPRSGETAEAYVTRLSLAKAAEVALRHPSAMIIAADTAVVFHKAIFGKPRTVAEAADTLRALRAKTHRVVTGVAALDASSGNAHTSTRSSAVVLRPYSDQEIDAYVDSGEPFDKAGSYAVQDRRFHPAIRVDGCYLNVVGLSLCEVVELLRRFGIEAPVKATWQPPAECLQCPLGLMREASMS